MAVTGSCRTTPFPDRDTARRVSRRARLASQIETRLEFCSDCEAWHLRSNDKRVDDVNRKVLEKVALGLRASEIATDLGLTKEQVFHRYKHLQRVFKTISLENLVATAIWLGVIDLKPLMPQFAEPERLLTQSSTTKGHDAE